MTKNLGIWMDHSRAYLMDFTANSNKTKTIESKFTLQVKEYILSEGETMIHSK